MYTLLGATVLGFDLVRSPGGGAVATLVAEALGLTAEDLPRLARAHPLVLPPPAGATDPGADPELPMADALSRMTRLVATGHVAEALQVIEQAPMAGVEDLVRCVRHEVFDWTWRTHGDPPNPADVVQDETAARAVDVVCDAVTAVHRAGHRRDATVHQLLDPWVTAHRLFPRRELDLGPCHDELTELLQALARLDADGWLQLLDVGKQIHPQGSWAPAMHSATWSVHLSGRVREGAAAQLRAARIVADGDLPPGAAARGVWNLVSGAVQSSVAIDLVDDQAAERLRAPVLGALGLVSD